MKRRSPPAIVCQAVQLVCWLVLWYAPWQRLLAPWPWLRCGVAVLLLAWPGIVLVRLLWRRHRPDGGGQLVVGFVLSCGLIDVLGLAARFAHLPAALVAGTLATIGGIGVVLEGHLPEKRPMPVPGALLLVPLLTVLLLAGRLALAPQVSRDDQSYAALVTDLQEHGSLGLHDVVLGEKHLLPPRYWLAFWPLVVATICDLSGLQTIACSSLYLPPFLAVLACLATYQLSRSLGLLPGLARLAVSAQLIALLLLTRVDQVGQVFFDQLIEDKVCGAFLFAPVLWALAARYLEQPRWRQLSLLLLSALALALTHATILGVACLVAAGFAALSLLATVLDRRLAVLRARLAAVSLLLLALLLTCLLPFAQRWSSHSSFELLYFSVEDAEEGGWLTRQRQRRLELDAEGALQGVNRALVPALPFALFAVVVPLALFRLRFSPAACLVLAAAAVIGATLLPVTARLLGLAITPFHLWRVLWLSPFGLTAAAAAHWLILATQCRGRVEETAGVAAQTRQRWQPWPAMAAEVFCLAIALLLAYAGPARANLLSLTLQSDWNEVVSVRPAMRSEYNCALRYEDLDKLALVLDSYLSDETVIVGDRLTNDFLPALSAKVKLVRFRFKRHYTMAHANLSEQAAQLREDDWWAMVAPDTTVDTRLQLFERYQARLLCLCGDQPWLHRLAARRPGTVTTISRFGDLQLYEIEPGIAAEEDP